MQGGGRRPPPRIRGSKRSPGKRAMTPADGGNLALLLAFPVAAYALVASLLGARRGLIELVLSARNGLLVVAGLVTLAALALFHALLTHDFNLRYVYDNSSRAMPEAARLTSFWGGQQGSLLLWTWGLALLAAFVLWVEGRRARDAWSAPGAGSWTLRPASAPLPYVM